MAAALTVAMSGNNLQIAGTGFEPDNQDRLVQLIATSPQDHDLGDTAQADASGDFTDTNIPYSGPGSYTVKAYSSGETVPMVEWTGTL
jgi:hypothetical protein